jgi:hypothetical protein
MISEIQFTNLKYNWKRCSSIETKLSAVKYLAFKIQNEYRSFRKLPAASPLPLHRV